jgi:gliding motility-associated-like protein
VRYELIVSSAVTNASCGVANGFANVTVSGGSGNYTYTWNTPSGGNSASINGLAAGSYTVTVEDAAGCSTVENVVVNNISDMVLRGTVLNATCGSPASGVIAVQVSGGTAPYIYAWSNGANTNSISNLVAGTYCLTVTDGNGCNQISCYTISSSGNLAIAVSTTTATCGENNGSATATASLGQAPYNYVWSNGQVGATASNLNAGTYFVTATDASGCSAVQSVAVSEAGAPVVAIQATNNTCANGNTGAIDITLQGGVGPFTFNWSNRATTQNVTGLINGTYSVVVTDANGCIATAIATVSSPSALIVEAEAASVLCNGGNTGAIDVTVNAGTAPYTYLWSNGETTQDLSGLATGNYGVTVFDANGCSVSTTINVAQPDAIAINIDRVDNTVCNSSEDGNIYVSVTGGATPYTYNWSNGATTEDLLNVGFGTYILTVTDANGCTTVAASVNIEQPDAVAVTIAEIGDVSCNGGNDGSVTISVAGGNAPYTYVWSNGATTAELRSVAAGSYDVTVTDVNGCTGTLSVNAQVGQPDAIAITVANVTGVPCFGSATGSINITVTGGIAPYTYEWSNAATTEDISGLADGLFIVTVTDANGCTATASVRVEQLPLIDLSGTVAVNPTCNFYEDGSISLVITGGSAPYNYIWSNGATTVEIDNLGTGTYSVTVTDVNGCTATNQFTIEGPFCNDPPIAITDNVTTSGEVVITVLVNDSDPNGDNIVVTDIIQNPSNGTVTINVDGTITYTPEEGFTGIDSFIYQICDDGIPSLCDTAVVYVTVLPERPNIFIPNGFSPDGDAYNEIWEIVDITQFPKNELVIFNRWGNKVFEAKPYLNQWNGVNQKGEDLPDGTYYYVLKLNDDNNTTYTGFVVVNRSKQ